MIDKSRFISEVFEIVKILADRITALFPSWFRLRSFIQSWRYKVYWNLGLSTLFECCKKHNWHATAMYNFFALLL